MLLKHENNKDVAIELLKSFYVKEKDVYKCKVRWWNIGPHPAFCMHITQTVIIKRQDMSKWKPYKGRIQSE